MTLYNMDYNDFERYVTTKSNLRSPHSRRHVLSRSKIFINWLKTNKKELSKKSVEEFLYELSKKRPNPNTLNTYISSLRQLGFYYQDRGIKTDAFDGLRTFPKYRPPIIILSPDEVEKLIHTNTLEKHYDGPRVRQFKLNLQTMRMFLAYTGCRFSETSLLKIKYLDLANGKVIIPGDITKNKQGRSLYITEPLISNLRKIVEGRGEDELIFRNFWEHKIIEQNFGKDLKIAAKLCGITKRVHAHLFRHTYGTYLYMATGDIGLVQLVLGHKDIKSTMIYIHLADDYVKKGMYRHPFIRLHVDPKVYIMAIEEAIRGFKLHEDPRFDVLTVKNAINEFTSKLYESLGSKTDTTYKDITKDLKEINQLSPATNIDDFFGKLKMLFGKVVNKIALSNNNLLQLRSFKLDYNHLKIDIVKLHE